MGCAWRAVSPDGVDHPAQRVDGGHVAVNDGEGFPVVGTDADLEAHGIGVWVVHDPTDLEPAHLSGHHAVLDDGDGTTGDDRRDEGEMGVGRLRRWQGRFGHRRQQGTVLDVPHVDREPEVLSATSEYPGFRRGQ